MFAYKEISHKVRGPTRSENAQHLLVLVSANDVCIFCVRFERLYTVSVLILHPESFLSYAIAPRHVLITQNIVHAAESKDCACVMRT